MWGGKQLFALVGGGAAGAAQSLASVLTIHTFTIPFRCRPIRAGITVTTIGTVQSAIVTFSSSGGSAGDCGKVTVPITMAANYGVYQETDYSVSALGAQAGTWVATLKEGQQVTVAVTQANTGGAGIPWLIVEIDPELPANNAVLSKTSN